MYKTSEQAREPGVDLWVGPDSHNWWAAGGLGPAKEHEILVCTWRKVEHDGADGEATLEVHVTEEVGS